MNDDRFVRAVSAMQTVRELAAGLCVMAFGLLIFFLFTAREAHADTWLSSTVTSYHFDRSVKHNEFNAGLGLERGTKDARLVAGFYDNSNHHLSLYAGGVYTPLEVGPANVGLMAGGVNGYGVNPRKWWLLVAPVVSVTDERFGINLIGAPKMLKHEGVIALQIKVKF